jgi:hypothetical protein
MVKKFSSIVALTLLMVFVPGVSAQEERMIMPEVTRPMVTMPSRQPMVAKPTLTFKEEIKNKRMYTRQLDSSREASLTVTGLPGQNSNQQLNARLTTANASVVDTWALALDQLEDMVKRASSEAAGLDTAGVNVTSLESAIARAEFAINTAKAAVMVQSEMTYAVPAVDNTMVRTSALRTINQLRLNSRITHTSVQTAKTAVRSVMSALVTAKRSLLTTPPVATGGAVIGE